MKKGDGFVRIFGVESNRICDGLEIYEKTNKNQRQDMFESLIGQYKLKAFNTTLWFSNADLKNVGRKNGKRQLGF